MKIDLDPSAFTSKDAYVRAALSKARDLAVQTWEDEHSERQSLIEREVAGLSKPELAKRLIKLLSRPNRARAQISDSMRNKAQAMRRKGAFGARRETGRGYADRRLPGRHLSVVLARPTGEMVVPRSALRDAAGRPPPDRQPA